MAGHEWDWFQREELIGQISDIRVQNLQVERENIQKRTFTRWINLHLEKCKPPLEVHDLFQDIQDGKVLMALLEVMSGQRLLHEHKSSSHRIFRLNNIAKSLKFLEDSNVKLISIDAAEIADGNPSMVLGLIWNIILFLQIKELTGNLNPMSSSSSMSSIPSGTDSDASFPSTPNAENGMSTSIKDQKKAIKALLRWVQHRTRKYGVAVQDFTCSWRSGLAFLALIKSIDSSLVDMNGALEKPAWDNLDSAFRIASSCLDIPRLLDPEDVMVDCPDEQSIMTYVSQFLEHFPEAENEDLSDNDSTIETRHVHYKDGPVEQECKIVTLNQSEEYAYTMSHDCLQPPPPKIYVCPETSPAESSHAPVSNQLAPSRKDNTQGLPQETESQTAKPSQTRHGRADPPWEFLTDNVSSVDDNTAKIDEGMETSADPSLYDATKCEGEDTVDTDKSGKSHKPTSLVLSLKRFPGRSDGSSYESVTAECFEDPAYPLDKTSSPTSESPVQNDSPVSLRNEEAYRYTSHLQDNSSKKGQPEVMTYTCESVDTSDQPILETPKSHTREGAVPKTPKGTAKVSVIPHDLFYYPHYTVPIADVLDAFLDSSTKYPSHSDQPHSFSTELDSTTLAPKNDDAFPCVPNTTIVLIPPKADEAPFTVSIIETRCNEKHEAISPEGSHVLFQDARSKCNGEAVIPRDMEQTYLQSEDQEQTQRALSLHFYIPTKGVTQQAKESLFEDAVEKMAEKDDDVWETANGFVAPCIEPEKASSTSTLSLSSRSSRSDTSLRHRSSHKPVKEEVIDDWVEFKESDLVDAASSEIREIPVHRRSVRDFLTSSNPLGGPLTEDFIYLLVFMWLVVYGILILPELDLTKIAFFSQEQ